jgi:hypothetical protein
MDKKFWLWATLFLNSPWNNLQYSKINLQYSKIINVKNRKTIVKLLKLMGFGGSIFLLFRPRNQDPLLKSLYSKDDQEITENYKKIPLYVLNQEIIKINNFNGNFEPNLLINNNKNNLELFNKIIKNVENCPNPAAMACPFNGKKITIQYHDNNQKIMINFYNFLLEFGVNNYDLIREQWNLYDEFRCLTHVKNLEEAQKKQSIYLMINHLQNKFLAPTLKLACGAESLIPFNNKNPMVNLIDYEKLYNQLVVSIDVTKANKTIDILTQQWNIPNQDALVSILKSQSYSNPIATYLHSHEKIQKYLFFKNMNLSLIKEYRQLYSYINTFISESVFNYLIMEMMYLLDLDRDDLTMFLRGNNILKKVLNNCVSDKTLTDNHQRPTWNWALMDLLNPQLLQHKNIYTFFEPFLRSYRYKNNEFIENNYLLTKENIFIAQVQEREKVLQEKFNDRLKFLSMAPLNSQQWVNLYEKKEIFPQVYDILIAFNQKDFPLLNDPTALVNFKKLIMYATEAHSDLNFIKQWILVIKKANDDGNGKAKDCILDKSFDTNSPYIDKFMNTIYPGIFQISTTGLKL